MDFVPDYNVALKQIGAGTFFDTYSAAYTVTNEDLRQSMQFMPEKCDSALVVAASGDHPLFCSLYGAKHVDTFDISYNAKCIMDVKVAALSYLTYKEYEQFLYDLYMLNNNLVPITDIPKMDVVLSKLPKIEYDYIYAMRNVSLFSRGECPTLTASLPTFPEYCAMSKNIKQPYNFILADICKIGGKLTKSYDFVHLSNVFDYVQSFHYETILLALIEHVRPGGRIVTQFFSESNDNIFGFRMAKMAKNHPNWVFDKKMFMKVGKFDCIKNGVYVLERVR